MNIRKIIQALNYLAYKQHDGMMDDMKAYKLLWLVDRYHVRQYGRTVTGDNYCALPYGPVPSNAKDIIDSKSTIPDEEKTEIEKYLKMLPEQHKYESLKAPDMDVFSESDIEVMDKILASFNSYLPTDLSQLSHEFPEWKHYENRLKNPRLKNGYKINMDLFFENKKEKSGLFVDDSKLLEMTKEVFHEYRGC